MGLGGRRRVVCECEGVPKLGKVGRASELADQLAGVFRVLGGILPRVQTKLGQESIRCAVGFTRVRVQLRNPVLEWLGLRLTGRWRGGTAATTTAVYRAEYRRDELAGACSFA